MELAVAIVSLGSSPSFTHVEPHALATLPSDPAHASVDPPSLVVTLVHARPPLHVPPLHAARQRAPPRRGRADPRAALDRRGAARARSERAALTADRRERRQERLGAVIAERARRVVVVRRGDDEEHLALLADRQAERGHARTEGVAAFVLEERLLELGHVGARGIGERLGGPVEDRRLAQTDIVGRGDDDVVADAAGDARCALGRGHRDDGRRAIAARATTAAQHHDEVVRDGIVIAVVGLEADRPALRGSDLIGRRAPLEVGALAAVGAERRARGQLAASVDLDARAVVVADLDAEPNTRIAREIEGPACAGLEEHGRCVTRRKDLHQRCRAVVLLARARLDHDLDLVHPHVARERRPAQLTARGRAADRRDAVERRDRCGRLEAVADGGTARVRDGDRDAERLRHGARRALDRSEHRTVAARASGERERGDEREEREGKGAKRHTRRIIARSPAKVSAQARGLNASEG